MPKARLTATLFSGAGRSRFFLGSQQNIKQALTFSWPLRPENHAVIRKRKLTKGDQSVEKILGTVAVAAVMLGLFGASQANGQGVLLARGTLTESSAGLYADLSGLNNNLE